MQDYEKVQSLENNLENLENGTQEYEHEYRKLVQENNNKKNKLRKYLLPILLLDGLLLSTGLLINLNYTIESYIISSSIVLISIPNLIILDRYRLLFKNVKESKHLEESISYLKKEEEKQKEKIDELKYAKEPIYITDYSYEEKKEENSRVRKLIKKKDK